MDQNGILFSNLMLELSDGFQKRLAFNITHRTTYFDNGNSGIFICKVTIETTFDLICDMRDHLNGTTLLLQNRPVNRAGGNVGIFIQIFIDESLIMSKIQIGFCTILRDKNFTMLDRVHRAGINIDIRIKFLHGDLITSGF